MIKCKHWKECNVTGGGCCSINEYDKPSFGVCLLACEKNTSNPQESVSFKKLEKFKNRSKGFGDTIKKVISKVTGGKLKQCGGCKKRQEALNKLMPYKDKNNG
jgi:hypothetical protein